MYAFDVFTNSVSFASWQASYTAQAVDGFFNNKITGGDVIYSNVTGFSPFNKTAVDQQDGSYRFSFMKTVSGVYDVSIALNGTSFYDSTTEGKKLNIIPSSVSYNTEVSSTPRVPREWTSEQTDERTREQMNERAGVWASTQTNERTNEGRSERTNERASERTRRIDEWTATGPGLTDDTKFAIGKLKKLQIRLFDTYYNNITLGDNPAFSVEIRTGSGDMRAFQLLTYKAQASARLCFAAVGESTCVDTVRCTRSLLLGILDVHKSGSEAYGRLDILPINPLKIERKFPDPADPSFAARYAADNPRTLLPVVNYDVEYETPISGEYSISVKYFGHHLSSSPYVVYVLPGETGAAHNCKRVPIAEGEREYTHSGYQSQKGRENIPIAGTRRRRGERIYRAANPGWCAHERKKHSVSGWIYVLGG
eukprot:1182727-Prorocentrum_minimum.AAC.3